MNKSRIEYENLIRNSILFSLDRETQAITYRREALKMVEYLYLYLTSINAERYSEYGLEITETANRCIKNYSPETGDFLNYFNSAIAKEYRKAYARKHLAEQHGGVHIPEHDLRIIRKYIKFAECQGSYELSAEMLDAISVSTGISLDRVEECVDDYHNSFTTSETYKADDGSKCSIFDLLTSGDSVDKNVVELDNALEFLLHLNEVFITRQARQKPLLSKLLTAKSAFQLQDNKFLLTKAKDLEFFDENIYWDSCNRETPISAREISASFGLSEQSVSRTYKVFISLL